KGAHHIDAHRDSRHRRQAPAEASCALWRPAGRSGGGDRRARQGRGREPHPGRENLPAPARLMVLNLPNIVTLVRILLIPLIVGVFYVPDAWLSWENRNLFATVIFILAAVTDWLDGYLARTLNQTSAFGAFLDPVADKLVVVGALIVLLTLGRVDMVVGL